jgi:eukaryotic-like serine/threonine-protein kinase
MKYGRYDIVKELGKGAMGVVYQARDPSIGRMIALKVLRPDRVTSEEYLSRFVQEARAIGRLSHPSVVVVHDIGEDHGTVYISMEFLDGTPLDEVIRQEACGIEETIRLGIQVADALDFAHKRGIIHRDIKPSNIIVLSDGRVKITDFGIAYIEDPDSARQTQAGTILGTPAYMSPEQATGQDVDGRSDIFSLGVILYEMATGGRPFAGKTFTAILASITGHEPPEPAKVNGAVPSELSRIIVKCLSKSPERRFSTGSELSDALKDCLSNMQTIVGVVRRGRPLSRSLVAAMLLVALIGLAGGYAYLRLRPIPVPSDNTEKTTEKTKTTESAGTTGSPGFTGSTGPVTRTAVGFHEVTFESTPPGASVIVDDEPRGETPKVVPLSAGRHEVQVVMSGYPEYQSSVMVGENKQNRVYAPLDVLQQGNR